MSQFGKYLRQTSSGYAHYCPGCKQAHHIAVENAQTNGARWSFNGSAETPTFTPSIKITHPGRPAEQIPPECCHYFIKAGLIEFCADSTHALAGQKIPLPEWPAQIKCS